jgi:hypothetical protein
MAGNVYLWSTTAATNASADADINWAEGQLPGTVNDSARGGMAGVAGYLKDNNATLTTGGSANAHTVTSNIAIAALATGLTLVLKAGFTNTAACTLNVTPAGGAAFGAKAIRVFGVSGEADPLANAIRANGIYRFIYDSTANAAAGAWILMNPSSVNVGPQLISTQTVAAVSTIDFTSGIDATYNQYTVVISGMLSGSSASQLQARLMVSGAFVTSANSYVDSRFFAFGSGSGSAGGSANTTIVLATNLGTSGSLAFSGQYVLANPSNTTTNKTFFGTGNNYDSTLYTMWVSGGVLTGTTGAVTGIRFLPSSGTLSGTFSLYGMV